MNIEITGGPAPVEPLETALPEPLVPLLAPALDPTLTLATLVDPPVPPMLLFELTAPLDAAVSVEVAVVVPEALVE
ncbi:MAG: hypothetical protein JST54_19630 [Deltaproteobacteria bacterium]|nr:hypothetical protein [Deltaproteobacteria bacterium]